ncbi:DUF58 domain-containing protein [Oscillatoria sp. FACHB-1406]|uniref:DUF58 domain-containing protein n=1 Tax=Oscillatoria sp. FACHB-1406 TaxID=2692846 RepID=UPI001687C8E8|nr:DUF58 domain-containing protein [Oscillatoria sp. FACHB-1406]MBD2577466.1 DUF58 domain-containing protein [Oscillatoria sp. FACHB-1406]
MWRNLQERLETRWVNPAYAGLMLGGVALCFFGAASNTMAGWLYAISGGIFALLLVSAILPPRAIASLRVRRLPIAPVSAGDRIAITLEIENPTSQAKHLLQIRDSFPPELAPSEAIAIETLPPRSIHRCLFNPETTRRGVYRWESVELRTGAPLGLFWCRRDRAVPAKAIVYPVVLPLKRCPLIDTLGREATLQAESERRSQIANEGITRTLRPYRQGDPTRLIHWRTSARLGEFQVRELEIVTGGQEIFICLDTPATWPADDFERAAIAAASLYFYASRAQMNVKLWTASTGLLQGDRVVLEALAATQMEEAPSHDLPSRPLIWLSPNANRIETLPLGSRWLLFPASTAVGSLTAVPGIAIDPKQDLAMQLQKSSNLY